ncbi:hypothetical protein A2U01_0087829, partial [Trifolium medium]|nr:hypothetical protein [Trifolium medium]
MKFLRWWLRRGRSTAERKATWKGKLRSGGSGGGGCGTENVNGGSGSGEDNS